MARKMFCDGCDKEIDVATVATVDVVPPTGEPGRKTERFDLCNSCVDTLKRHLPKAWLRPPHSPLNSL